MANGAILREPGLHVIGVRSACVIFQVAAHAAGAGILEISIQVAGRAVQCCMYSGQRETRKLGVVKFCVEPAVHVVTGLAGGRESRSLVVGRLGLGKVLNVARDALRRKALELAHCRILMTVVAGQRGVRSDQWETILVRPKFPKALFPAHDRMAPLAIFSKLSAVDVGVAVCATCPCLCKHQAHVACGAGNAFVQSAQWIAGLVVVKLHDISKGFPGCEGMAIFAGDLQIAVGAVGRGGSLWRRGLRLR